MQSERAEKYLPILSSTLVLIFSKESLTEHGIAFFFISMAVLE